MRETGDQYRPIILRWIDNCPQLASSLEHLSLSSRYLVDGVKVLLHAALYTQDGRYVAGIDGDPVTFESTRNIQLGSLISAEGETDVEAEEPFRPYVQGRATDLQILQAGTHRVTATWKGLSVSAEFIVTELSASSDAQP